MGWKSTKTITREKAISLIIEHVVKATDSELSNALSGIGFGDNTDLPYYGCNFSIGDEEPDEEFNIDEFDN